MSLDKIYLHVQARVRYQISKQITLEDEDWFQSNRIFYSGGRKELQIDGDYSAVVKAHTYLLDKYGTGHLVPQTNGWMDTAAKAKHGIHSDARPGKDQKDWNNSAADIQPRRPSSSPSQYEPGSSLENSLNNAGNKGHSKRNRSTPQIPFLDVETTLPAETEYALDSSDSMKSRNCTKHISSPTYLLGCHTKSMPAGLMRNDRARERHRDSERSQGEFSTDPYQKHVTDSEPGRKAMQGGARPKTSPSKSTTRRNRQHEQPSSTESMTNSTKQRPLSEDGKGHVKNDSSQILTASNGKLNRSKPKNEVAECITKSTVKHGGNIIAERYIWRYIQHFLCDIVVEIAKKHNVDIEHEAHKETVKVTISGNLSSSAEAENELSNFIEKVHCKVIQSSIEIVSSPQSDQLQKMIHVLHEKYTDILLDNDDVMFHLIGPQRSVTKLVREIHECSSNFEPTRVRKKRMPVDKTPTESYLKKGTSSENGETKSSFPTSPTAMHLGMATSKRTPGYTYQSKYKQNVHVFQGDITKLEVDGVVNASNSRLEHDGGVAAAILKAAGKEMQDECRSHVEIYGKVHTAKVFTSDAFKMPCRKIIHVSGPIWKLYNDKGQAKRMLRRTFHNCLEEAERNNFQSLAIPAVGSGLFGAPTRAVANEMKEAIRGYIERYKSNAQLKNILLVDISAKVIKHINDCFEQEAKETPGSDFTVAESSFENFHVDVKRASATHGKTHSMRNSSRPTSSNATSSSAGHHSHTDRAYRTHQNKASPTLSTHISPKSRRINKGIEVDKSALTGFNTSFTHMIDELASSLAIKEDCVICMDKGKDKVVLKCKHVFCRECIYMWAKDKPTCPSCGKIYGKMVGTQPEGTMVANKVGNQKLPGHETSRGTIVIDYYFPGGYQMAGHPHPGRPYQSTFRRAFLPDSRQGNEILELLKKAFNQKLIFTIGTSATTGSADQITWNDIHHKTRIYGGPDKFGYPDPTYLYRVREELAAKGID